MDIMRQKVIRVIRYQNKYTEILMPRGGALTLPAGNTSFAYVVGPT
jgi:hypothetical protein